METPKDKAHTELSEKMENPSDSTLNDEEDNQDQETYISDDVPGESRIELSDYDRKQKVSRGMMDFSKQVITTPNCRNTPNL